MQATRGTFAPRLHHAKTRVSPTRGHAQPARWLDECGPAVQMPKPPPRRRPAIGDPDRVHAANRAGLVELAPNRMVARSATTARHPGRVCG